MTGIRLTVAGPATPDTDPVDAAWRQMNDLLADRTPPALAWLRGRRVPVARDGGRWRPLGAPWEWPPLSDRQIADLTWYRPVRGTRSGMPHFAFHRPSALVARWGFGHWWALTYADDIRPDIAPVSDVFVALASVRYEIEADR